MHGAETIFFPGFLENGGQKRIESKFLAESVQRSLVSNLKSQYDHIKDRGVTTEPYYVLMATAMPSVLVNIAFITNQLECNRLRTESYQDAVATGIAAGIMSYITNKNLESQPLER